VLAFLLATTITAPAQQQASPPQPAAPGQQQPPAAPKPAAPAPAAQPTAPPNPSDRVFATDSGAIFNLIKPDKAADFEAVLGRVKEALARSSDPKRVKQAASWRVFKSPEPGPGGNVVYVFWLDPAVKDADYSIVKILQEGFPAEVQALYTKLIACYPDQGGQSLMNLELRLNMSPGPGK
jgi:hypothetical protein